MKNAHKSPVAGAPAASDGRPVVYGIRPEHFQLSDAGVPIEVVVVEPTGSETQVVARAGGQEMICVLCERVTAAPGSTIRIQPNPALAHLLDQEGGRRLV